MDYSTDEVEVWPDNEVAADFFGNVGTRWMLQAMASVPYGLRWEAIYPLMDRLGLAPEDWDGLQSDLMVMEREAIATMLKFKPKDK